MQGFAVFKSQKLLKIRLEHDGSRIGSVKIHGDFFMYPEDALGTLEHSLVGVLLEKEKLQNAISTSLVQSRAEAFGFNAPDLVDALLLASKTEVQPP